MRINHRVRRIAETNAIPYYLFKSSPTDVKSTFTPINPPSTNKKEKTVKHITGKVIFYAMAFVDSGAFVGAAPLPGAGENLHNR